MSTKKLARLVGIFFNIYFFGTYLVRSSTDHYIFRGLRVFSLVLSCNYVGFIWCQNFLYNFFLKYIVFEDYFELNNLRVFSRCYLSKSNYLYIVDRFNFWSCREIFTTSTPIFLFNKISYVILSLFLFTYFQLLI